MYEYLQLIRVHIFCHLLFSHCIDRFGTTVFLAAAETVITQQIAKHITAHFRPWSATAAFAYKDSFSDLHKQGSS